MRCGAVRWLLAVAAFISAGTAHAEVLEPMFLDLPMSYYGQVGQTAVYRGTVNLASAGSIDRLTLTDLNTQAGSSGIFSGFDLDFVYFHDSPDFGDSFGTIRDPVLTAGDARYGAASPYQPTANHPGDLFGTDVDGSVRTNWATLNRRDARYTAGDKFSVDSSSGWVSLGDGGSIDMTVTNGDFAADSTFYIFIGDAGQKDEYIDAQVKLFVQPAQVVAEPIADAGGSYSIAPGQTIAPDGSGSLDDIHTYEWFIGDQAIFPPMGVPQPGTISYDELYEYGFDPGEHDLTLKVSTEQGGTGTDVASLTIAPPPAISAASAELYLIGPGDMLNLDAGASTGPIELFRWRVGGNVLWETDQPLAGTEWSHEALLMALGGPGEYGLTLETFGAYGQSRSDVAILELLPADDVPEPASAVLLAAAGLWALRRRRRS